ncbi:14747_t:CDS:1, partial [Dentiscutata heterogama]
SRNYQSTLINTVTSYDLTLKLIDLGVFDHKIRARGSSAECSDDNDKHAVKRTFARTFLGQCEKEIIRMGLKEKLDCVVECSERNQTQSFLCLLAL